MSDFIPLFLQNEQLSVAWKAVGCRVTPGQIRKINIITLCNDIIEIMGGSIESRGLLLRQTVRLVLGTITLYDLQVSLVLDKTRSFLMTIWRLPKINVQGLGLSREAVKTPRKKRTKPCKPDVPEQSPVHIEEVFDENQLQRELDEINRLSHQLPEVSFQEVINSRSNLMVEDVMPFAQAPQLEEQLFDLSEEIHKRLREEETEIEQVAKKPKLISETATHAPPTDDQIEIVPQINVQNGVTSEHAVQLGAAVHSNARNKFLNPRNKLFLKKKTYRRPRRRCEYLSREVADVASTLERFLVITPSESVIEEINRKFNALQLEGGLSTRKDHGKVLAAENVLPSEASSSCQQTKHPKPSTSSAQSMPVGKTSSNVKTPSETRSAEFIPQIEIVEAGPTEISRVCPDQRSNKKRSQDNIMKIIIEWAEERLIRIEDVCMQPVNRANIARAFGNLLVLARSGFVNLCKEGNCLELKTIQLGSVPYTFGLN